MTNENDPVDDVARSLVAVGQVIGTISAAQWSASTPCTEWSVRRIVEHLVGMNRVFAAVLTDRPPPGRGDPIADDELAEAYRESATLLLDACRQPGLPDRLFAGPLGTATGDERIRIRLYDLLAHGWDLAKATGQVLQVPDDIAERSLSFARGQVSEQSRPGRFEPPQAIAEDAPAIERLVAFLGRPVVNPRTAGSSS